MFFKKNKKEIKEIKEVESNIIKQPESLEPLSGFLDLSPDDQIIFANLKNGIRESFQSAGFTPFDIPLIEKKSLLLANAGGETAKEIYEINKGDKELALRFDLTIPLAKYIANNYRTIRFPFKRYQIDKVFRGERAQKGRFREFYQCDVDIVGNESLSIKSDAEIVKTIYDTFKNLKLANFKIKINNRKVLSGFLSSLGLGSKATESEILRIIDKFEKISIEEFKKLLADQKLSEVQINQILDFINLSNEENNLSNENILGALANLEIENDEFLAGLDDLNKLINYLQLFNLDEKNYSIDLKIARGFDYYTGSVFETFLTDYKEFGSICSGGRYDNLTSVYSDKVVCPGVGASIGLTRLFSQLKEAGLLENFNKSYIDLMVLPLTENLEPVFYIVDILRDEDLKVEVFLEDKSLKNKLNYANQKKVKYVLFIGDDEIAKGLFKLKDMISGEEFEFNQEELLKFLLTAD